MIWFKKNILFAMVNKSLSDLPTPSNLSFFWNFGSLLGLCLLLQMMSGMLLAMHYSADMNMAFSSIVHISKNVNYGFLLSYLHANGASLFFFVVYLHMGRGLFYGSYFQTKVWFTGMIMFFFMMLTAFMGYVLPWGQMSFWGATVMTNLLSAIPYIGSDIVLWVWGGFSVSNATLNSFYSLHYLLPFLLFGLVLMHLVFLHTSGSNNPLGVKSEVDKVPFHSYFVFKDLLGYFFVLIFFVTLVFLFSNLLNDPENYMRANPLVTPAHIQPEWYFLFAYAILSSVPNKLGGVLLMGLSMIILFFVPFFHTSKLKGLTFRPLGRLFFWFGMINFLFLTWIGSQPVENPFMFLGQMSSLYYFIYFILINPLMGLMENWMLFSPKLMVQPFGYPSQPLVLSQLEKPLLIILTHQIIRKIDIFLMNGQLLSKTNTFVLFMKCFLILMLLYKIGFFIFDPFLIMLPLDQIEPMIPLNGGNTTSPGSGGVPNPRSWSYILCCCFSKSNKEEEIPYELLPKEGFPEGETLYEPFRKLSILEEISLSS